MSIRSPRCWHCAPLFLTDGFRDYLTALVTHYGQWMHPERRQAKGPQPKPRWMPLPGLLYAQVVTSYRRRRIVGVKHRVIFGPAAIVESILAKRGWKINTSFVERLNLDFRQHVAAIGRRVNTLCKHEAGLRQQLVLFQVYHNFVLPHASLRLHLPELDAVPETGALKRWQARTPVMAAGLSDRVWSLREVLMYRVPPWPQTQMELVASFTSRSRCSHGRRWQATGSYEGGAVRTMRRMSWHHVGQECA